MIGEFAEDTLFLTQLYIFSYPLNNAKSNLQTCKCHMVPK